MFHFLHLDVGVDLDLPPGQDRRLLLRLVLRGHVQVLPRDELLVRDPGGYRDRRRRGDGVLDPGRQRPETAAKQSLIIRASPAISPV